jgi:outer membrane protein assembly factor BamB
MIHRLGFSGVLSVVLVSAALVGAAEAPGFWPRWRGPNDNGVAPAGNPPTQWSETLNVRWKTAIPGLGTSTPIIWGDLVFILTAVPAGPPTTATTTTAAASPAGRPATATTAATTAAAPPEAKRGEPPNLAKPGEPYEFLVIALDRATGALRWQKQACKEVPHEGHHLDHGFASASPVTDGQHLIASFGSRGVYGYDLEGNLKWEKRLGQMKTRNSFGEGSSPALHGNTVIVVWDHEGDDFIVALDKSTGQELWRRPREEPTNWTTPLVVDHNGRTEVMVNGTQRIRSYDLATGELLWECAGMTLNAIPTPLVGPELAYFTSGFRGSALLAIKLGGKGDLTGTPAIAWQRKGGTPYVPSALLYGDFLYFLADNNALLTCLDAATGKAHFEGQKLPEMKGMYASPVGVAERVYLAGRAGKTTVIRRGPALEILACNTLDDRFDASPAVAGDALFLRGHRSVYCIAAP